MNSLSLAQVLQPGMEQSETEVKKTVLKLEHVNIHYGSFQAVKDASFEIYEKHVHRSLGLWKKYGVAEHQPDERYDPWFLDRRQDTVQWT